MIKTFDRYIAKVILRATAYVVLIVASIMSLMMLLQELKSIGSGDYNIIQALYYVLLRLPNELYHFSPILILLGCIIGLSVLSSYRELMVIRASGLSLVRMIYSVMIVAFLLVLLMSGLGEWFAPHLNYKAVMQKENARNAGQAVITAAGVWFHVDNNFIHIERMTGRELLEGITRYQFDDKHRLQAAYYAKTMSLENKQWQMHDVVKTTFYEDQTKSYFFTDAPWNLKFNTNLLNTALVKADEMSLSKLAKFAHYLKQNGLQANEYQYEFWQRIFQPFVAMTMVLLALPIVLNTLNTMSLGWRLMMGIIIGFMFLMTNAFLGQLCVVYQLPAVFAASFPLLFFACIALLLARVK